MDWILVALVTVLEVMTVFAIRDPSHLGMRVNYVLLGGWLLLAFMRVGNETLRRLVEGFSLANMILLANFVVK